MTLVRGECRPGWIRQCVIAMSWIAMALLAGSCRRPASATTPEASTLLRIGWTQVSAAANPLIGLRQLTQILSVEALARPGEDGRMGPSMAENWTLGEDGRSLTVKLKPNVTFHDGSPADSQTVASILPGAFRAFAGPVFSDIEGIHPAGDNAVAIAFRQQSPFLIETLDSPFQKPGGIATGPFKVAPNSNNELVSNEAYYLGPPSVKRVQVEAFSSIRTAWAEMLRDRIDMLYEVGPDALQSMENSSTVSVFTFTRRFQYVIVLNPKTPAMRSAAIRRGLNEAINRDEIVRTALNGYGVVSLGPIWPKYWAFKPDAQQFTFDPGEAARVLGRRFKFSCLMPPDFPFERIALEVKRQLAAVGVDMVPEEVSYDDLAQRAGKGDYEAMLIEVISGPTLLRPYLIWHSEGPFNWGRFGAATTDAALDRVRHARSDSDYREAVAGLQQNFMDDPPAIFLAWSVRARAVSKRFTVPDVEVGRDVLSNLRLWKPASDLRARRN
jgi:peptide/nickel transport system substrate-binding protein